MRRIFKEYRRVAVFWGASYLSGTGIVLVFSGVVPEKAWAAFATAAQVGPPMMWRIQNLRVFPAEFVTESITAVLSVIARTVE